jgi:hypothetical protein
MQRSEAQTAGSGRNVVNLPGRQLPQKVPSPEVEKKPVQLYVQSFDGRFSILRAKQVLPTNCQIILTSREEDVYNFLTEVNLKDEDDVIAFDTETTGLVVFGNESFRVVTLGFCHDQTAISLDLRDKSRQQIVEILNNLKQLLISRNLKLVAHNLFYDASVIANYLGCVRSDGWMPYRYCTYAMFRYLSSEGWEGQSHSLKFAMKELLLWTDTNEVEQDSWLINNGYVTLQAVAGNVEAIRAGIAEGKEYKPDKSQMYRVPHDILGRYNALDCFATYQLYREVLLPCVNKYTTSFFKWWHEGPMMTTIRNGVDNYQKGIFVDLDILRTYRDKLSKSLSKIEKGFRWDNEKLYQKICAEKFKKFCEEHEPKVKMKIGKPPSEPKTKRTKAGYMTAAYKKYLVKQKTFVAEQPTKAYLKFLAKKAYLRRLINQGIIAKKELKEVVPADIYKSLFNPNSKDDKLSFLYDNINYEIIRQPKGERPGCIRLKHNQVELDMTGAGGIPCGKAAILAIGGPYNIFNVYNKELKKSQFVDSCIDAIERSNDGMLHLPYKIPGTNSMRLSGDGGVNCQNLVKDAEFLRAWRCHKRNSHLICQADLTGVEPHVLTEFSRDESMLGLYGPGAKPNDVYIYGASLVGGKLGQCFLDEGYDPKNPTKEAISACKKKYKVTRNAAKAVILSDDYGSKAYKKWQSLRILGFDFQLEDLKVIQENLDKVFAGKRAFQQRLEREWERNKGFILDGFGMPVCVNRSKIKDLTNRSCQRTATLILMLWQHLLTPRMYSEIRDFYWMIFNFHDEMIPEVPRNLVFKMKKIYEETLKDLNDNYLKGMIKIKAEPQVATCLAEIKVENYIEEELQDLLEDLEGEQES